MLAHRTSPWRWSVVLAFMASGCATSVHVIASPAMPPRDEITKDTLRTFMRFNPHPKIVLRVPTPQSGATDQQARQGDAVLEVAYNTIEKELLKAGFTVRDRGLLNEVIRTNPNLDYRTIRDKIDTQLILEIVSFGPRSFDTREYTEVATGRKKTVQLPMVCGAVCGVNGNSAIDGFQFKGWKIEAKVVLVETGEIGGIYTIDIAPGSSHFVLMGDGSIVAPYTANEAGVINVPTYNGLRIGAEVAAAGFVRYLFGTVLRPL